MRTPKLAVPRSQTAREKRTLQFPYLQQRVMLFCFAYLNVSLVWVLHNSFSSVIHSANCDCTCLDWSKGTRKEITWWRPCAQLAVQRILSIGHTFKRKAINFQFATHEACTSWGSKGPLQRAIHTSLCNILTQDCNRVLYGVHKTSKRIYLYLFVVYFTTPS
jgi:hypothetical protein